jgi:hypothetical protein
MCIRPNQPVPMDEDEHSGSAEGEIAPLLFVGEHDPATHQLNVRYSNAFHSGLQRIDAAFQKIEACLFAGEDVEWWEANGPDSVMMENAINFVCVGCEPSLSGEVCVHASCQAVFHQLVSTVEVLCSIFPAAPEQVAYPPNARGTVLVNAMATALLLVYKFTSYFLDEVEMADCAVVEHIQTLTSFLSNQAAPLIDWRAQLRVLEPLDAPDHEHVCLNEMGVVLYDL